MVLVDTSAWVEFARATGSPAHLLLRQTLQGDQLLATTDAVVLELLASAAAAGERASLRAALAGCEFLDQSPRVDAEAAVDLFQRCRSAGFTPRSSTDCLIAAIAIRNDVPVLHGDQDFDALARHTSLRVLQA
jgi:predicted nucleic acid-binding protein